MLPENTKRWRYRTPTKTGRWYNTRRDAEDAAVYAGAGVRNERGEFQADVLTTIEYEDDVRATQT